jgi:hypothetical protein
MLSANISPEMSFIAPSGVNSMKQMKDQFERKMQYPGSSQSYIATQSLEI